MPPLRNAFPPLPPSSRPRTVHAVCVEQWQAARSWQVVPRGQIFRCLLSAIRPHKQTGSRASASLAQEEN
ncbi:unnamed protein product, partial [Gulo gulo]